MKKKLLSLLLAMTLILVGCGGNNNKPTESSENQASEQSGETTGKEKPEGGYTIGFSNSYNGNSYRQRLESFIRDVEKELQASGELKEVIFANSNQNNSTQVQQIENFILQGVDAIIVDPGSATALNGAIQQASDKGIPVFIVNDGPISCEAENLYQINFDTIAQMSYLTEYIAKALNGKGNIIELRGTAGAEFDNIAHKGVLDTLGNYPDIKIVTEIYTDWTGSKAQSELASVLPTLGEKVDGIVTQGGDSYAAVQAFQSAGLDLPIIGGDNRGYFINWWAKDAPKDYDTISVSSNPWNGAAALYVAMDVLDGKKVPKDITFPFAVITKEDLPNYTDVKDEDIAAPSYDREWVRENLYK